MKKFCLQTGLGGIAIVLIVSSCGREELAQPPSQVVISLSSSSSIGQDISLLSPEGNVLHLSVDIARAPEERQTGLMYRRALENDGMLFIFDAEQPLAFWMKNTLIPLDIIYFDQEGLFVSSISMQPCTVDPCKTYPSSGAAMYALEVEQGFIEREGVGGGWHLRQ